jgi:hypothetical protein
LTLLEHDRELASQLENLFEPFANEFYGPLYRCAAHLKDGTYLPCVVFSSRKRQIDILEQRFNEVVEKPIQFRQCVEWFCTSGSRVDVHSIAAITSSPYALTNSLISQILGETSMGWTCFVMEMRDGVLFNCGTSFERFFFELPDGYVIADIKEIHSNKVVDVSGELVSGRNARTAGPFLREKSHFSCYLTSLDGGS